MCVCVCVCFLKCGNMQSPPTCPSAYLSLSNNPEHVTYGRLARNACTHTHTHTHTLTLTHTLPEMSDEQCHWSYSWGSLTFTALSNEWVCVFVCVCDNKNAGVTFEGSLQWVAVVNCWVRVSVTEDLPKFSAFFTDVKHAKSLHLHSCTLCIPRGVELTVYKEGQKRSPRIVMAEEESWWKHVIHHPLLSNQTNMSSLPLTCNLDTFPQ